MEPCLREENALPPNSYFFMNNSPVIFEILRIGKTFSTQFTIDINTLMNCFDVISESGFCKTSVTWGTFEFHFFMCGWCLVIIKVLGVSKTLVTRVTIETWFQHDFWGFSVFHFEIWNLHYSKNYQTRWISCMIKKAWNIKCNWLNDLHITQHYEQCGKLNP